MMFPAHRHMDSHTQSFPKFMSNPYHCYPSWETVPPDMRVDTSMPPSSFGPWVHNGINSYPGAYECNNCCMHSHHPPGYYYCKPPCPHIQPPQHAYAYGAHPAYHGAFPYFVSPPYPFEQPRRDYDNTQSHCCACQRMDNKGVKIEEQKPEVVLKGSDSSLMLPNHHHMKEKEQINSESQPTYQYGWIPLGSNGHKFFGQPGDEHETMHDKVKNPFPWPIIWMPGYNKPEEAMKDLKKLNTNTETSEETSPKLKIIPMRLLEDGNHAGKPGVPEDEDQTQGRPESLSRKEDRTKTIPVKQAEESIQKTLHIEDNFNEEADQKRNCLIMKDKAKGDAKKGRTKTIPVKQVEENSEKELTTDVKQREEKNQKNDPTKREKEDIDAGKASGNKKLSPICLRVSPLPRKKSSNSSSPSPSPRQNGIEQVHVDKQVQRPSLKDTISEVPKKVFKVTDADARDEVEKQTTKKQHDCEDALKTTYSKEALETQQVNQGNSSLSRGAETSKMSEDTELKRDTNKGDKIEDVVRETEQFKSCEGKQEGKTLSPMDAAVLIQSVYRGFEVRRWQPIQKLRKIHQIRMQMENVRRQIRGLEVLLDHQDKKKRVAVNENIMNLLLQLDTIQGMHHFVREARKAAARELISLQEKLDALAKQEDSIKADDTSGNAAGLENAIGNANLDPTMSYHEQNSSQPSEDKVSQDPTTMVESVGSSSEQESNLETSSRSAELKVNSKESLDNTVVSTLMEEQEETLLPNKESHPEGNMLYLANQEPSPEESAKPSMFSSIQANPEVCFISGNESLPFSVNIVDEDQVLDSQFELMKQGLPEPHQGYEVDAEEDPPEITTKSEISSDAQEPVEPLQLDEQLDSKLNIYPITEEENNVQEMPAFALAIENKDDTKKVVEVDAQNNGSEEPHANDANIDHQLGEDVNTIGESMDILVTDPIINVTENLDGKENVEDSPVVDKLNKDISGGEGGIKEEAILTPLEAPQEGSQLDIMRPKEGEALDSKVPKLSATEIQSAEAIECSPLLLEVSQQMIQTTAEIPREVSSGELQGIEDECIFPEHMISAGETDARQSEESLKISKHHDERASPRDVMLGNEEIKLVKENENLRQTLENLLEEGRAQIGIIHELNGRVKDLEKKLSLQRKKARAKRYRLMRPSSRKLAS